MTLADGKLLKAENIGFNHHRAVGLYFPVRLQRQGAIPALGNCFENANLVAYPWQRALTSSVVPQMAFTLSLLSFLLNFIPNVGSMIGTSAALAFYACNLRVLLYSVARGNRALRLEAFYMKQCLFCSSQPRFCRFLSLCATRTSAYAPSPDFHITQLAKQSTDATQRQ